MINSVGFVILYKNKILLSHPRKQGDNTWGIAKGKVEKNETYLECAIRETKEEIGLDINLDLVKSANYNTIVYKNAKSKAYKKLHYYIINIEDLNDIGMNSENIEEERLSPIEIDESKFMTFEEAENKIFWRQKEILNLLK